MMNEEETTQKIKFPTLARKRMKEQDEHQNTNKHAYKTMMEHSNHEIQKMLFLQGWKYQTQNLWIFVALFRI